MRRIQQTVFLLAVTGLLSACGASRPVSYYMLDVASAPAAAAAQQFPVSLSVGRVATTHLYRDDRLVFGAGPVELGTYEYERWAESPADMVQDILISSLRSTGQYRSVSRMNSAVRADYIVRGHLFGLYEVDKPQLLARFSMQLELVDPKSGMTVWTDSYAHDEPVSGKKVADVVEALDKDVRAGVQQLTAGMGEYFAAHPPQQPPGH
ncbi:MAG TPA: ABC-type transport auxiliary lipoprotein family protein [Candidatus Acidoferrum sp.]|nr:ABC-type transport auxiliary lipoprotein family protein [Candidatus Acidoferrum sp.]